MGTLREDVVGTLRRLLPLVAIGVYGLICATLWVRPDWRPEWDSALYILLGQSLAVGEGYQYLGEAYAKSPPGMPWLISLALPDGRFQPLPLNRMVMAFAVTAVGAGFFALGRLGGARVALAAALLAGTSPLWVGRFNWVLAEFPFITLVYLALGFGHLAVRRGGWAPAVGAALCLAGAFYFRSIAVLAFPALLFEGLRGRRRTAVLILAAAAVLSVPWIHYSSAVAAGPPGRIDQLLVADYLTAALHVDPGDPGSAWVSPQGWLERIERNGGALLRWLSWTVSGTASPLLGWGVLAWAGLGLARVRQRGISSLDVFFVLYLLLLATYFTYAPRLLTPLLPLFYFYMLTATGWLDPWLSRLGRPALLRSVRAVPALGLLCVNLLLLPHSLDARFWRDLDARTQDLARVATWLREETSPDAVVLCGNAPILSVLAERRAFTHRFQPGPALLEEVQPGFVIFDWRESPGRFHQLVARNARRRVVIPSERFSQGIPIYEMDPWPSDRPAQGAVGDASSR